MKKILLGAMLASLIIPATGCKDSVMAQFRSLGSEHQVSLYSGGKLVGEWHSTGNVSNQEHSDGYYFEEKATHKLIEVSGTVVIIQL